MRSFPDEPPPPEGVTEAEPQDDAQSIALLRQRYGLDRRGGSWALPVPARSLTIVAGGGLIALLAIVVGGGAIMRLVTKPSAPIERPEIEGLTERSEPPQENPPATRPSARPAVPTGPSAPGAPQRKVARPEPRADQPSELRSGRRTPPSEASEMPAPPRIDVSRPVPPSGDAPGPAAPAPRVSTPAQESDETPWVKRVIPAPRRSTGSPDPPPPPEWVKPAPPAGTNPDVTVSPSPSDLRRGPRIRPTPQKTQSPPPQDSMPAPSAPGTTNAPKSPSSHVDPVPAHPRVRGLTPA
jgi:hypothetical protein